MSEDPSRAVWLSQASAYLCHADPVLARLIDGRPGFDPRAWLAQLPPMDLYGALLFQVTGQQLSVAATRRTLARIRAVFGGHLPAPAELLAVYPGQLRQEPLPLETNLPGVFAAGDVRCGSVKRCSAAIGEGSMAVALVHRRLAEAGGD